MISPYDPPKTTESQIPTSRADSILRWIGVLCFGYLVLGIIFSDYIALTFKIVGVVLNSFLAIGLLRLGRRFCLGVAIFLGVTISVQAYFTQAAIANWQSIQIPIPNAPWMIFARAIIPHLIILACAATLFYRLPRRIRKAEVVTPNGP